jgi:DnaJ-domain-containing protein 1
MTDYFALLGEPRLPWLDADHLKARFHALSTVAHPDRFQGASGPEMEEANRRFAELNAAYNCLRETKDRLLHLIELESGSKPRDVQRIPPGTMDLFAEVGQMCRDVDGFLVEKTRTTSPLVKVQLFEQAMEWTDRLNALQRTLNVRRDELECELRQMEETFKPSPGITQEARAASLPLERLEQIYRIFSYLSRWTGQIQERIVQLSF